MSRRQILRFRVFWGKSRRSPRCSSFSNILKQLQRRRRRLWAVRRATSKARPVLDTCLLLYVKLPDSRQRKQSYLHTVCRDSGHPYPLPPSLRAPLPFPSLPSPPKSPHITSHLARHRTHVPYQSTYCYSFNHTTQQPAALRSGPTSACIADKRQSLASESRQQSCAREDRRRVCV